MLWGFFSFLKESSIQIWNETQFSLTWLSLSADFPTTFPSNRCNLTQKGSRVSWGGCHYDSEVSFGLASKKSTGRKKAEKKANWIFYRLDYCWRKSGEWRVVCRVVRFSMWHSPSSSEDNAFWHRCTEFSAKMRFNNEKWWLKWGLAVIVA